MVRFIVISLLLFSASLTLLLTGYSIFKLKKKGNQSYIMLMLCISIYCIGYILELSSSSVKEIDRAIFIQYLGIPLIPVFWLNFSLAYTEILTLGKWHYLLYILPVITIAMVFSNQLHHLYYKDIEIAFYHNLAITKVIPGPWYQINMAYGYLLVFSGIILFLKRIFQSNGIIRTQSILTLFSALIPWSGNIIYISGNSFRGLDYTPFFLTLIGPLLLMAMSRYKMLNLSPIATRKIFNEMREMILVLDSEHRLVDYNPAAAKLFNTQSLLIVGNKAEIILTNEFKPLFRQLQTWEPEIELVINKNSQVTFYKSRISSIPVSREKAGSILTIRDFTAEKKLINTLETLATTDELTGISNRRHFLRLCEIEMDKFRRFYRPMSFLLMDLDHFKQINDRYGHQAGDQVLIKISETIQNSVRAIDIAARFGGEEFIAALPETDSDEAHLIAERLREEIETLVIRFNKEKIFITISIGIYTIREEKKNHSLDYCISKADKALYEAKAQGRNRVTDYSDMETSEPSIQKNLF